MIISCTEKCSFIAPARRCNLDIQRLHSPTGGGDSIGTAGGGGRGARRGRARDGARGGCTPRADHSGQRAGVTLAVAGCSGSTESGMVVTLQVCSTVMIAAQPVWKSARSETAIQSCLDNIELARIRCDDTLMTRSWLPIKLVSLLLHFRPTTYQRLLTCYTVCQPSMLWTKFLVLDLLPLVHELQTRSSHDRWCRVQCVAHHETMQHIRLSCAVAEQHTSWHLVLCLHDRIPARQKQPHNLQRASSIVREGVLMHCPQGCGDATSNH